MRRAEERAERLRHLRRAAVAAVLDVELEAAGGAEAEDRRRIERQHQRFLDACGLAEQFADQLRRSHLAFVPMLLRDENRRGVVAKAPADKVEAGERDDVLVRGIGANRRFHLIDHLERALERRAVRQNHRADVIALVLVGYEAPRRDAP